MTSETKALDLRKNVFAGRHTWRLISVLIVVALAATLPFVLSNYRILQATMVLIYAITLLGLNLLTGYNGQISLGHGAFYGVGAYIAVILITHARLPYWSTIPIVALICL